MGGGGEGRRRRRRTRMRRTRRRRRGVGDDEKERERSRTRSADSLCSALPSSAPPARVRPPGSPVCGPPPRPRYRRLAM